MKKQKAAFSLIEAAIVLGIVGLVIGGIWVAAAAVQKNRRMSQALAGTLVIRQNLDRLFNRSVDSNTLFNNVIALKGADGFYMSGANIASPLDKSVVTLFYNTPGNARITFVPNGEWISVQSCIKFISMLSGSAKNELSFIWTTGTPNAYFTTFPVIPTAAQCTQASSIDIGFK